MTGAGRGIGQAIAGRLAEAGASVLVCDLNAQSAAETVAIIQQAGGSAAALQMDVSKLADAQRVVAEAKKQFGGVDILVNNAALFPPAPILEIDEAQWDKVLDVNLKGSFFLAQAAAREMVQQGRGGKIVNIVSLGYKIPPGLLGHYDASKGGMVSLTQSLAKELGPHGIRVNAIAPGHMLTPGGAEAATRLAASLLVPMDNLPIRSVLGRYGQGDDVAKVAYFLASGLSDYVTGSVVEAGGGYQLH